MKCGHVGAEGAAGGRPVCARLRLLVPRPVSSGRQNGLEADAELFPKPILPQMNQRLFEILLRVEQLHRHFLRAVSTRGPPPSSMWGDHAPGSLIPRSFSSLNRNYVVFSL